MSDNNTSATVTGLPNKLLRLEGLLVFALAVWAYSQFSGNWWLFALLFFAPDLFMLGYLKDPKLGALIYNIGHTYLAPAILWLLAISFGQPLLTAIALIWAGHIGFDRVLGYGLKYPTVFKHTHLSAPPQG